MIDFVRSTLTPRPGDPSRSASWLAVFGGFEIVLGWVFATASGVDPTSYGTPVAVIIYIVVPAALMVLAYAAKKAPHRVTGFFGLPAPLMFIAGTVIVHGAGPYLKAGDLLVLVLPVLYGAYYLKPPAAWLVTALAMAALGTLSFSRLETGRAWHEVAIGVASLLTINALFVWMREREDALQSSLRAAAELDPLTGLGNRRGMDRQLAAALSSTPQVAKQPGDLPPPGNPEHSLALIVLDIDNFKVINDTFGHPIGDAVLRHVADVVRATLGTHCVAWRTGGDELAIASWCSDSAAGQLRQQVCDNVAISQLHLGDGTAVRLSVSAGLALSRQHPDPLSLFSAADQGMYAAKETRRASHRLAAVRPDAAMPQRRVR